LLPKEENWKLAGYCVFRKQSIIYVAHWKLAGYCVFRKQSIIYVAQSSAELAQEAEYYFRR